MKFLDRFTARQQQSGTREPDAAEKWNGQYPTTLIMDSGKGQILQLPLAK
jgi:hypothetical protein